MEVLIPQQWSNATQSIVSSTAPPIVLVCGPKNCGKTIFSLHLVNALLQRYEKVAYLDTDVDQAVFTPPYLLSLTVIDGIIPDLTSPSFKTPERCFFFGDISSRMYPDTSLKQVFRLFDHYMKEYCTKEKTNFQSDCGLPLVINTRGRVRGTDYEILMDMIKYMSPTNVVKIQVSLEKENLPAGAFWMSERTMDNTARVIEIKAATQDLLDRSAQVQKRTSRLRDSRIQEYFEQCFPCGRKLTDKEFGLKLVSHPPYKFPTSSVKIKHLDGEIVNSTEIYHVLNCSIVGLAISSDVSELLSPCVGLGAVRDDEIGSDVSEQFSSCVGLGLVRSVDPQKGMLYIITPVPQETLEDVDLLLLGFVKIPRSFLEVPGYISPYLQRNVL